MIDNSLIVIVILNVWYRFTLEHYIPPPKFCLFAQTCNHTWIPICGHESNIKHDRMFLDECDMFEYNCDNQKAYFQTGINNYLEEKCMETLTNRTQTSPMEKTSMNETTQSALDTSTTTEITTAQPSFTNHTHETVVDVTTEAVTNLTIFTTQETITLELTSSDTSSSQMTTVTLPAIPTMQKTTDEPPKIPTTESKNKSNETKSILTSCTARPFNTTIPQNSLDTNVTSITHTTEQTETTKQITLTISSTLSTTSSQKDIPFAEITITTSEKQNLLSSMACEIYPEHCDRPKTWETTVKGETRDFFQILKARFGNRFRILQDTTHWLRRVTPHINDVDDDFQFGRHNERKEFD